MAAYYSIGLRTSGTANASAAVEIRAGSRRVFLHELGITLQAATASTLGLGRPANTPAGGTNNTAPPEDTGDAAFGGSVILASWTTPPTAPTTFFRRIGFPATIGSGVIWTFRDLVLPINGSLVLWNLAANGVLDVYAALEEA